MLHLVKACVEGGVPVFEEPILLGGHLCVWIASHAPLPVPVFAMASAKLRAEYVSSSWAVTSWHIFCASPHSVFQFTFLSWFPLRFTFPTVKGNLAVLDNF